MNFTHSLRATDQSGAMPEIHRQCFLDRFIGQQRQNSVRDFAHALGVKLAEFAIDRNSPPYVDSSESRIRNVFLTLFAFIFTRFSCQHDFEFIGWSL